MLQAFPQMRTTIPGDKFWKRNQGKLNGLLYPVSCYKGIMMRSFSSSYRISSCHLLTSPSWAEEADASFPHFPAGGCFQGVVWEAGQQRKKWKVVNGTPPASGGNRLRGLLHPFQLNTTTQGHWVSPASSHTCDQGRGLIKKKKKPMFRQHGYQMWLWDLSTVQERGLHKGGFSFFINLMISASLLPCSSVSH